MNRETPPEPDLEELLRPLWPELRRILAIMLRHGGQPAGSNEVDELLSSVIAEALPKFTAYDRSQRILSWLAGFAAMILRRRPREQRRERRMQPPDRLEELLAPPDQSQANRERLEECLVQLPAAEREVIRLSYLEGLTGERLAVALGTTSVNAAYLKKTRALKKLKEIADRQRRED